ncbi:hypothetical protein HNP84_008419 [Thermocatellispora tengchongensis]|uniref:Uncharacterized protein n=1 Tax=Thermocatellispora tengchongensis TaxID=1073253 RepID=A0A840PRS5_9ACTN|nr:hypothetical protein [Thermocatellispora tengchongensis]MBB5138665.1 hypothetical protein [Thermocatellispora tengchongensis]
MGVGVSVFFLTLGAILKFAIDDDVLGDAISIDTIGLIFMIVGGAGVVLSLVMTPRRGAMPEGRLMHRENPPRDDDD